MINLNLPVTCLLDRSWNTETKKYDGTQYTGTLISISSETSEFDIEAIVTVGVVILSDNTFQSVPIEFIKKVN